MSVKGCTTRLWHVSLSLSLFHTITLTPLSLLFTSAVPLSLIYVYVYFICPCPHPHPVLCPLSTSPLWSAVTLSQRPSLPITPRLPRRVTY